MLVYHHHPDNKDRNPAVVASHQAVYKRSGVDARSLWVVEWEGLGEAILTADIMLEEPTAGAVVINCDAGDIFVDCEYPVQYRLLHDLRPVPLPPAQVTGIATSC
jgi:hypothetical protein